VGHWFHQEEGKSSHKPGMTHPFWWPLSSDAMRQVVFEEVIILTIFNPAHLFEMLENAGYIVSTGISRGISAEKTIDGTILRLEGISHYFEMIQKYFFSEQDVVRFLSQVEEGIPSIPGAVSGRIELHVQQHFGNVQTT
jgi:hypothetical protein